MTEFKIRSDIRVDSVRTSALDKDVAAAARVSTLGFRSTDNHAPAERLINFLMRDRHGSPFEHNSMTFYVEAPIFVAREWFRHRAGWSYNEESARYRTLGPAFYSPGPERPLIQVGKPGAYTFKPGDHVHAASVEQNFRYVYREAYQRYQGMLQQGIAREVARMVLPVGIYTSFYATCNARSLMHFLSLRTTDEASTYPSFPQREIEMAAEQMEEHFKAAMPLTHAAFQKHGRVAP
ncbi:ThyX-like thymidylate synthase [Streptomyces phage Paedore]|uniref:ThyX-like thymidylate synthase n=1 Tax=Streptomyces phage Paedore TaxID=2108134 RepID=A0A2P1JTT5_9CAUD|nr:thymidylate synthase [Streptomyces phage Paedore]AVO22539.1 ThyX-like thymidylate synthase [Streptomyces phage Paedore]